MTCWLGELSQARLDHRTHRGRQQFTPGLLLHDDRSHFHVQLQPPDAIGTQPWHQQLKVAPQLEHLQQIQRLPTRLGKQEVTQPDQRPLRFLRRHYPCKAVLTLLTTTPPPTLPLPSDGLHELNGLRLAQCLQRDLRHRQVPPQVGELCRKLRPGLLLITAHGA